MPRLPGPSSIEVRPRESNRPVADFNTTAAGLGMASFGASIGKAADQLYRVAEYQDDADNKLGMARARAAFLTSEIETRTGFKDDDPNFDKWPGIYQKATGDALEKASQFIPDPRLREQFKLGAQDDLARGNASIMAMARRRRADLEIAGVNQQLEDARVKAMEAPDEETRVKFLETGRGLIDGLRRSGHIDEVKAQQHRLAWDRGYAKGQIFIMPPEEQIRALNGGGAPVVKELATAIEGATQGSDVSPAYLTRLAQIESSGGRNLANQNSSARGPFQFINSTWQQYGSGDRMDFNASAAAVVKLTQANARVLRNALGREPTDGELYLAHQQGAGGAAAMLNNPNAPAASFVGEKAIRLNGGTAGMTAGEFANKWVRKFGDAGGDAHPRSYLAQIIPLDERQAMIRQAETRLRQETRASNAGLDVAYENAIAQAATTGVIPPNAPTQEELIARHGDIQGAAKFAAIRETAQLGQDIASFSGMTDEQANAFLKSKAPVLNSETYAQDAKRHEVLSAALQKDREARNKDPFSYVVRNNPALSKAWEGVDQNDPSSVATAIGMSDSIMAQIGIRPENRMLMPKATMDAAVKRFNDDALPQDQRIASLAGLLFATNNPQQRQRIMAQMEAAGVDGMWRGVFDAMARGDAGAARRLATAAMVKPGDLPGKLAVTPAQIDQAIQDELMAPGKPGDAIYGLRAGLAENSKRATEDGNLIKRAITLDLAGSGGTDAAASARKVIKDRYGDIKTVAKDDALFTLPSAEDEGPILAGLRSIAQSEVRDTLMMRKLPPLPSAAPVGLLEAGNIDLGNRPIVKNKDGTISTVRSMSVNIDGREVLIPTVSSDGKRILSDDEAVEQYRKTGQHLGIFDTPQNATAFAKDLSKDQGKRYGPTPEQKRAYQFALRDLERSTDDLIATGQWREGPGGFVFMDRATGGVVPGRDGNPMLVIPLDVARAVGKAAPHPAPGGSTSTVIKPREDAPGFPAMQLPPGVRRQ